MSGLLLDTNALMWVVTGDHRLGADARRQMRGGHPVHFSAVSALEVTIKTMLGRLETPEDVVEGATRAGLIELPFRAEHAARLRDFPALTRHDPFDRMILAQARHENARLLTSDRTLLSLSLDWVLDSRQ